MGIKEETEGDPVNETLDIDRQMHQPSAPLFPEFTDRKADRGKRRHRRAEERVSRNKKIASDKVVHGKVDTKRNDHRIQDNGKRIPILPREFLVVWDFSFLSILFFTPKNIGFPCKKFRSSTAFEQILDETNISEGREDIIPAMDDKRDW